MNPAKPVSERIEALHDRTAASVTEALGLALTALTPDDEQLIAGSRLMNVGLETHAGEHGLAGALWRVD